MAYSAGTGTSRIRLKDTEGLLAICHQEGVINSFQVDEANRELLEWILSQEGPITIQGDGGALPRTSIARHAQRMRPNEVLACGVGVSGSFGITPTMRLAPRFRLSEGRPARHSTLTIHPQHRGSPFTLNSREKRSRLRAHLA